MVLKIIFLVWVLFIIGWLIIRSHYKVRISFKEAMDLAELPIVTFYQEDKKFNFLLDTGSNQSHISMKASKKLKGKVEDISNAVCGLGKATSSLLCKALLSYKSSNYEADLYVTDGLDEAFSAIKKESGVQLHGILGNDFFQKYGYILDFENLTAYHR